MYLSGLFFKKINVCCVSIILLNYFRQDKLESYGWIKLGTDDDDIWLYLLAAKMIYYNSYLADSLYLYIQDFVFDFPTYPKV